MRTERKIRLSLIVCLVLGYAAVFVVWTATLRDSCASHPVIFSQHAWGEGAFHDKDVGCIRFKPWYQW